jgi:hypothetical protein
MREANETRGDFRAGHAGFRAARRLLKLRKSEQEMVASEGITSSPDRYNIKSDNRETVATAGRKRSRACSGK